MLPTLLALILGLAPTASPAPSPLWGAPGQAATPSATATLAEQPADLASEDEAELEVTYLANSGFLLETPIIKVVVDGFIKSSYLGYDSLTKKASKQLTNGEAPFDGRILGLVSHGHRDHFQARIAGRLLAANPGSALVSSPQVVNALGDFAKDKPAVRAKLFPIMLGPGESDSFDLAPADASIEFMNLSHAGDEKSEVLNYGHLIRIGDFKILHLGDADAKRELFEPFDLTEHDIDVAFIPSWFFASAEGTAIIDEFIRPRIQIACHVPPSDLELFTERMKENNPHVIVFQERMETRSFSSETE